MSEEMADEPEALWVTEKVECAICGHGWIAVHEEGFDVSLECPNCGNVAGHSKRVQ